MEIVMEEISKKYKGVVNPVFYNVTQKQNDAMATYFSIDIIPTQVLLDVNGLEFFRHIGYYPTDSLSLIIDKHIKTQQ
jgi:thioredoxin 1